MDAKYEVSISYGSKVIPNVKVDNRQTNKQAEQKQYAPFIRSWDKIKSLNYGTGSILRNNLCFILIIIQNSIKGEVHVKVQVTAERRVNRHVSIIIHSRERH